MKKSNLKSYDSYKEQHIKENFLTTYTPDENLEDIKDNEDEEEVESSEEEGCEECETAPAVPMALGTEEEKQIETPEPIIAHVEVQTEIEAEPATTTAIETPTAPVEEIAPQINNQFNPAEPTMQADLAPKIFSIVRIMTQNGEKIGMCYTEEVGEYGTPIHNNIDFKSACDLVKQCCLEGGVEEFRNDFDTIIGTIPSFMIPKKNKGGLGSTSYKPN
jgi:hypothetical protein